MKEDTISTKKHIDKLKKEIYKYSKDEKFLKCNSMGQILKCGLEFLTTNYENVNPLNLIG